MSRWARLRTLSSSATARRYCSQWLLARSSDSASACCRRSSSTSCEAVSGSTVVGSAAGSCRSRSLEVIARSFVVTRASEAAPPAAALDRPHGVAVPRGWGSAPRIQGGAEEFSRHIDDRDNPFVGHARGTDDPEHPDHAIRIGIGGGHDAAVIQDVVAGFVADEDLHPLGLEAVIEQVQEVALLVEGLEQAPQLLHVGELGHPHEVGLALDHVLKPALAAALEHLLGHRDGIEHDLVHVRVRLGELAQDLLTHLAQGAAAALLAEVVRGALELLGAVAPLGLDDAVLYLAVVEDQHHEYAVLGERHELNLAYVGGAGARQRHDTGQARGAGEQLRHRGD